MVLFRENITWPPVREEQVLARSTGGESRKTIILSSHANVAPVEAVSVLPEKGVTQNQKVYRAGTVLARITIDVGGGEAESDKWGPFDPAATDDGRDAQACAFLGTGVVANNNAIRWTARRPGNSGRNITVTITDPAGANQPLTITVTDQADGTQDIDVSVATDGASAITSTAAQIIAAINAHAEAGQLVLAANEGASDGTGVVVAAALAALAGDRTDVEVAVLPKDVNVELGDVPSGVYVGGSVFRADILRGYSGNEANLDAAFADQSCKVESVSDLA